MPTPGPDDLTRLFAELHAAPTRFEGLSVLNAAKRWLADLPPREREVAYERAEEILAEKTEII
jgi:hypothetical protein